MKIIIFFVMNAFLIKENRDFPLIKDYHSNLRSSLSYFIFFPSFCYIWSSCNKEKNKPPFLMQKMSLKLRVRQLIAEINKSSATETQTLIYEDKQSATMIKNHNHYNNHRHVYA